MEFHDFAWFLGESGMDLIHTYKLCASLVRALGMSLSLASRIRVHPTCSHIGMRDSAAKRKNPHSSYDNSLTSSLEEERGLKIALPNQKLHIKYVYIHAIQREIIASMVYHKVVLESKRKSGEIICTRRNQLQSIYRLSAQSWHTCLNERSSGTAKRRPAETSKSQEQKRCRHRTTGATSTLGTRGVAFVNITKNEVQEPRAWPQVLDRTRRVENLSSVLLTCTCT